STYTWVAPTISTNPMVIATRSSTSVTPAARLGAACEVRCRWVFMASTRGHLDLHLILLCPALLGPADRYGVRRRRSSREDNRPGRRGAHDCPRELPLPPVQIVGSHLRGTATDGGRSCAAVVRGCTGIRVARAPVRPDAVGEIGSEVHGLHAGNRAAAGMQGDAEQACYSQHTHGHHDQRNQHLDQRETPRPGGALLRGWG